MALEVEDGTAKNNADSYSTLADFNTFITSRNVTTSADTATKEAALREATAFLDGEYANNYPGYRKTRTQALLWPREFARDAAGFTITSTEVPKEIKAACLELALERIVSGTALAPSVSAGADGVVAEKVGPIEVRYTDSASSSDPIYRKAEQALTPLFDPRPAPSLIRG